jgi:hypothetical protein
MTEAIHTDLSRLDVSIDELASKGEFAALAALLADDFVYSHSTGLVQDKQEWLESLKPWSASATAWPAASPSRCTATSRW